MGLIRRRLATLFRQWARTDGTPVRHPRATLDLTALEGRYAPATLTVNSTADNTTSDAVLTLREAVLLVNNTGNANAALGHALSGGETAQVNAATPFGTNDTIIFNSSVFTAGATITVGSALPTLNKNVNLQGLGPTLVTINGNQLGSVLTVGTGVTASVSGLTLTNGRGPVGGGLHNLGFLTVSNSSITNNTATQAGGGIGNEFSATGGVLTVTNSTISGNTVTAGSGGGGGGIITLGGTVAIVGSTITGNSADFGGGISNGGGTMTVNTTTITGNTAGVTNGGGIENEGTLAVANSTISANTAVAVGITGATWAANVATVTTATAHDLVVGQTVTVTGINPAGYNGTFTVITASGTTFTYALGTNPGAYTGGGTLPGGGGIYNSFGSQLQLLNTTVSGNTNGNTVGTFSFSSPLTLTPSALPVGQVGRGYSQTISATGTGAVTLAVAGSALPPGLTVSQAGPGGPITVSGTPTAPGSVTGTVTVTATDSFGTTSATYTVTVNQAPTVSAAYGPTGLVVLTVDSTGVLSQNGITLATGVRSASVAFGSAGIVVLVTYQTGALVRYDSTGSRVIADSGIQGASLAFGQTGEVLMITTTDGALYRFDPTGLKLLASSGILGASLAIEPSGEVLLVTTTTGALYRLDSTGLNLLANGGFDSIGVAYGAPGEALVAIQFDGSLLLLDATGLKNLGVVA